MPVNLLDYNREGLTACLAEWGEKPFRAKQLLRWIHQNNVADFAAMTDIARSLRQKLETAALIAVPNLLSEQQAADGTVKWLLGVDAANGIESVFIPEVKRNTLCVSSQIGCALDCHFCSTGKQGFNRNLSVAEIIGQLWWANYRLGNGRLPAAKQAGLGQEYGRERLISNVVLMGMGEPLANYRAVVAATQIMLDDHAYGLSRRRVTVSTSGMVPQIRQLARDCPVSLAVSLHAPNDAIRDKIVPINKKYPLRELISACQDYLPFAPRDFITFEYIMLAGINDQREHARQLLTLLKDIPCKINLIPFNPFPFSGYGRSRPETLQTFRSCLQDGGLVVTVRKTRGKDIDAACGQLAGKVKDKTSRNKLWRIHLAREA